MSLTQGPVNRVQMLSPAAAVRALAAAMEFYPWAQDEFDMVLNISSQIAADNGVMRLVCTPDRHAVDALKQFLEGGQA